jgi:hypothetical protein
MFAELAPRTGAIAMSRDVFLQPRGALGAALPYNNVLSVPFAIDRMMPPLQAVVDGDPDTAVPTD